MKVSIFIKYFTSLIVVRVIESKIAGGGRGLLFDCINDDDEEDKLLCTGQGEVKNMDDFRKLKDRR